MDKFNHGDRVRFTPTAVSVYEQWRDKVGTVMDSVVTFNEIVTVLWDEGDITREGSILLESIEFVEGK